HAGGLWHRDLPITAFLTGCSIQGRKILQEGPPGLSKRRGRPLPIPRHPTGATPMGVASRYVQKVVTRPSRTEAAGDREALAGRPCPGRLTEASNVFASIGAETPNQAGRDGVPLR